MNYHFLKLKCNTSELYRPIVPLSHLPGLCYGGHQPVFYLIKMPQVLPTFFFKPSSAPGRHFTSLNPSPQCLRFRPDSFPSMPCWYCISSSLLIFLSSCPTENTAVTGGTPANSGLSTHGQIWVAGVEWGGGYINHWRIVGNSVAAFQKCCIKELTTAEVWCGLVVTDDEAASMFLLENKNQYDSFASSLLRGNLATFTSNSPSQHPSGVKISASFHHFPDQLRPILKSHPTTAKRFIRNLSRNNVWL